MKKQSAGLLMYRIKNEALEVLLVHPGGPFWAKKDLGAWSIPKGEFSGDEEPLAAATRELREETGFEACEPFVCLGVVTQKSGKVVHAWAFKGDCDPSTIKSNLATVEWPPHSGRTISVPEIDKAAFFSVDEAKSKINVAQAEFLIRLIDALPKDTFRTTRPDAGGAVQGNLF